MFSVNLRKCRSMGWVMHVAREGWPLGDATVGEFALECVANNVNSDQTAPKERSDLVWIGCTGRYVRRFLRNLDANQTSEM